MSINQAHANPANSSLISQHDVYRLFLSIADRVLESTPDHDRAHVLIQEEVDALYAQHQGETAWDLAYYNWIQPSDDDPEEV